MRYAICLSGQLRDWRGTFETFIRQMPHCDVFISTWNTDDTETAVREIGPQEIVENDFDTFKKDNVSLRTNCFYKERQFDPRRPNGKKDLLPSLAMFFNIWKCNELKKRHEQQEGFTYDVVIRLRSELNFLSLPNQDLFQKIIEGSNCIYVPKGYEWGGITDLFAFGSSQSMDTYSSVWTRFTPSAIDHQYDVITNNEELLIYHLESEGLPFKKKKMDICLRGTNIYPKVYLVMEILSFAIKLLKPILPKSIHSWLRIQIFKIRR
jgi:hypothetical protein